MNAGLVTMTAMVTRSVVQEIADLTLSHVRTVERRLLGLPVRGRVRDRIDTELARRGLLPTSVALRDSQPPPSR